MYKTFLQFYFCSVPYEIFLFLPVTLVRNIIPKLFSILSFLNLHFLVRNRRNSRNHIGTFFVCETTVFGLKTWALVTIQQCHLKLCCCARCPHRQQSIRSFRPRGLSSTPSHQVCGTIFYEPEPRAAPALQHELTNSCLSLSVLYCFCCYLQ